jgi:hypothetical protein
MDEDISAADLRNRARDVAINLESAICKEFGPTSKEYGAKARTLIFNMQDTQNVGLRLKLMAGVLTPKEVVKMPAKELANDELREERERMERDNLESRRTDWQ